MSYNYTTKIKVSALSQIPTTDLNDEWSDWVEALIDEYVGESYTGLTTHTAEKHDGDGSGILFVDHPPIVSVSAMSVDASTLTDSDYKVYNSYVKIISDPLSSVSDALYQRTVFPEGQQNVSITYVGGSATVPKRIEMAATQMIAQIALVYKREGSDASLKYSRVTRNDGDVSTTTESFGLQGTLYDIMKKYLNRNWKMAVD